MAPPIARQVWSGKVIRGNKAPFLDEKNTSGLAIRKRNIALRFNNETRHLRRNRTDCMGRTKTAQHILYNWVIEQRHGSPGGSPRWSSRDLAHLLHEFGHALGDMAAATPRGIHGFFVRSKAPRQDGCSWIAWRRCHCILRGGSVYEWFSLTQTKRAVSLKQVELFFLCENYIRKASDFSIGDRWRWKSFAGEARYVCLELWIESTTVRSKGTCPNSRMASICQHALISALRRDYCNPYGGTENRDVTWFETF